MALPLMEVLLASGCVALFPKRPVFNFEDLEHEMDFANRLPPSETHVRDMVISKKSPSGVFVPRRIVTTDSHIYFCAVFFRQQVGECHSAVTSARFRLMGLNLNVYPKPG